METRHPLLFAVDETLWFEETPKNYDYLQKGRENNINVYVFILQAAWP